MQQTKGPQKPLVIFFALGLFLVVMLNALLPSLSRTQQVPYSQFLQMLEQGQL